MFKTILNIIFLTKQGISVWNIESLMSEEDKCLHVSGFSQYT